MTAEISITREAIDLRAPLPASLDVRAGARAEFTGIVRGVEADRLIAALEYEAYQPMAEMVMRRILETIARRHPCLHVRVMHRIGLVPVGEAAIHVVAASAHRAEAFAMVSEFMDRLKQDVPIWKVRAVPADSAGPGSSQAAGGEGDETAGRLPGRSLAPPGVPQTADAVVALLRELATPLNAERLPLAHALDRVIREEVTAPEDQPAFDRSAVDGFAVRLDDASTEFAILDHIRAGEWKPRELQRGECVRIATGGALPCHGLQVVMKEDATVTGTMMRASQRSLDRCIRFRGDDARAGQVLVANGSVLTPGSLALLASVGCAQPLVTRLPRVAHLATGNEIVPPEKTPQRGQIRDSNSMLVRACLERCRIAPVQARVPEDEAAAFAVLERQAGDADLLLISGGASVGEHDFTRRLLERAGFEVLVSKTTSRPGKPLIMARRGPALAFGLPGNPLAHFVCLNLFVRAALAGWSGCAPLPLFRKGVLAEALKSDGNARETFWPARGNAAEGAMELTPLRWASSGDITSLATANALVRVVSGVGELPKGTVVEYVNAS